MFYLILMVILTIITIAGFFGFRSHLRDEISREYRNNRHNGEETSPNLPNVNLQAFVAMSVVYAIIAGILTLIFSLTNIDKGHVGVASVGGAIIPDKAYSEGFQFTAPWISITEMDLRRHSFDFTSGGGGKDNKDETVSISKDNNPITTDVSFPITLNPNMAWKVLQKIGDEKRYRDQIAVHARSAVREAVAKYGWEEATTTKINELAVDMRDIFEHKVVADLMALGFTESEAKSTFTILPVNLRKSLPDEAVIKAISAKMAAKQDLERQKTLTDIAAQEALRRKEEGSGVKKLFEGLPRDIPISDVVAVMNAASEKIRADAFARAVEHDKVNVIVVPSGGAGANISVAGK